MITVQQLILLSRTQFIFHYLKTETDLFYTQFPLRNTRYNVKSVEYAKGRIRTNYLQQTFTLQISQLLYMHHLILDMAERVKMTSEIEKMLMVSSVNNIQPKNL